MNTSDDGPIQQQLEALKRKVSLMEGGLHQAERLRKMLMTTIKELKSTQALLLKRTRDLNETNADLSTLHRVSSAILHSRTVNDLCHDILNIMDEVIRESYASGVFLVEDGWMKLAAYQGDFPCAPFLAAHTDMQVGQCLCGWVAQTGEVYIAERCAGDSRKTIAYQTSRPHGHIIIPFKTQDQTVAVYFCYMAENARISEHRSRTFQAIGEQLGIAFENFRLYDKNEFLSLHDPLTGLANRRCMEFTMDKALEQAKRYAQPLSVIMADIDYFKKYNDTYGHLAGDELLVKISQLILQETRTADLAVRYGGEEILILLPMADIGQAQEAAERMRESIAHDTHVTISMGIASLCSPDCTMECLIRHADDALYRAKKNGRNQIQVYDWKPECEV